MKNNNQNDTKIFPICRFFHYFLSSVHCRRIDTRNTKTLFLALETKRSQTPLPSCIWQPYFQIFFFLSQSPHIHIRRRRLHRCRLTTTQMKILCTCEYNFSLFIYPKSIWNEIYFCDLHSRPDFRLSFAKLFYRFWTPYTHTRRSPAAVFRSLLQVFPFVLRDPSHFALCLSGKFVFPVVRLNFAENFLPFFWVNFFSMYVSVGICGECIVVSSRRTPALKVKISPDCHMADSSLGMHRYACKRTVPLWWQLFFVWQREGDVWKMERIAHSRKLGGKFSRLRRHLWESWWGKSRFCNEACIKRFKLCTWVVWAN